MMKQVVVGFAALISLSGCSEETSIPGSASGRDGAVADAGFPPAGHDAGDSGVGTDSSSTAGSSREYYVAIDGNDLSVGTIDSPFATLAHAVSVSTPGTTIHVRGGTYAVDSTLVLNESGVDGSPIRVWAYQDERPILDFATHPRHADPPRPRDNDGVAAVGDAFGIHVSGDYWHLSGLTVRNAPYYGIRVYGSHNVFEQLILHDNKASGLEITGKDGFSPSDNLVLNCDSYHNFDPQSSGEDADGFAAKFDSLGPGNIFRGTRAWSNSDDGYDFWHAANPVTIEDCWAFDNGFNRPEWAAVLSGGFRGDGFGFKLGQDAAELQLVRVVAWGNKGFGVDENGNRSSGGVTIAHATLVNNAKDGNPIQIQLNDGRPHTVVNSVAFDIDGPGVADLDTTVDDQSNSWNGIGVTTSDFESLDMARLFDEGTAPRGPNGSLPSLGLRLTAGSRLIDAGMDTGTIPFEGAAPDVGAFERIP